MVFSLTWMGSSFLLRYGSLMRVAPRCRLVGLYKKFVVAGCVLCCANFRLCPLIYSINRQNVKADSPKEAAE
jgi:hypothetical protein